MEPASGSSAGQARPLTLFDAVCIGVNAIVGSSLFLIPGRLAGLLGPASVLAFVVTGAALLPVALCFSGAARLFDGHGGPYLYAREAFGADFGFGIGWMCWITELISFAAVADGVGLALAPFSAIFAQQAAVKLIAVGVIAAMAGVNARGVKLGAWTSDALTVAKVGPLAALVIAAASRPRLWRFAAFAPHGLAPLGPACFLAYFAFQGFEVVPVPAGEVGEATRKVPLAVLLSLAVSAAVYVTVQAAAVACDPGLSQAADPLAHAAGVVLGPAGAALLTAAAALSMVGFTAGCALGGPRYLVALAERGDLPASLAARRTGAGSPAAAIAATAVLAGVAAVALDFERLVGVGNVVIAAQYVATCVALPILQARTGRGAPGVKRWALPVLGVCATLWLGAQGGWRQAAAAAALLAAGFIVRAALRRI